MSRSISFYRMFSTIILSRPTGVSKRKLSLISSVEACNEFSNKLRIGNEIITASDIRNIFLLFIGPEQITLWLKGEGREVARILYSHMLDVFPAIMQYVHL